jgi:uncharacterized protein (TIGR03086 family)
VTVPGAEPRPDQVQRRLIQAMDYADEALRAVTPQLLSSPTPCRDWNLRMLLEHVHESVAALHEGVTAGQVAVAPGPGSGAGTAAGLVGTFRTRATALVRASAESDGDGDITIGGHPLPVDCLRTVAALELAVHAWDISQTCGQRLPIPDDLAADLLAQAHLLVPRSGRSPLFAPPVPPPPRPTPSDRLIAYLGRLSRK